MNRIVITALVVIHLIATIWHGSAHENLGVTLPLEKNVFVYLVILLAPVVGAVLVWTRQYLVGVWMFYLAMLGALLFGVYHHYVMVSPDNIGHLPHGPAHMHSAFINSAATIALLELVSALYASFCLGVMDARAEK